MRRVLMVLGALLAACVPQLATAAPVEPVVQERTLIAAPAQADGVRDNDTVRIAVVAHVPLADSLVSDSVYVTTLKNRAVAAVMLGLNASGIRWSDAVVGLQYAKPPNTVAPTGRSSSNSYWRLGSLARDSGSYARTRLRLTRT